MRKNASYLGLLGAVMLVGCPQPACPTGMICIDTAAGDAPSTDAPMRDTNRPDAPGIDTGPLTCGSTGQVGGACRTPGNTCASGLNCQAEFAVMGGSTTIATLFDIAQGEPDPANPGYFRAVMTPDPANDIPFHAFTGGLCTAICDSGLEFDETMATGELDTCGDCASCTTQVGQLGFVPSWVFLPVAMRAFDTNTGFCRADCTFDPATNGGCPDGYTCSPATLTCVESCTTDNECRLTLETTRRGELLTTIAGTSTCSTTTGRCVEGMGDNQVGVACTDGSTCSDDVGLCLRGGTCGEYNCGFATDTAMDGTCDGGSGVCLGQSPNNATICIEGCRTAADCNPGSACLPLQNAMGMPVSIGPMMFSGICLGLCDIVLSDPDGPGGPMTTADDDLINCRAEERCDMGAVTATDFDPDGVCRAICMTDANCDAGLDERCEMQPAPATYGFCRVPDQLCGVMALDDDCYLGQRCDLLAQDGNNGLCVDGCTADTDCTGTDTCDTTRGVCRTPCTSGGSECTPDVETCLAGLCEQLTT